MQKCLLLVIYVVLYCLTNNHYKIILMILEFYFGKQNSQNDTNLQTQYNIQNHCQRKQTFVLLDFHTFKSVLHTRISSTSATQKLVNSANKLETFFIAFTLITLSRRFYPKQLETVHHSAVGWSKHCGPVGVSLTSPVLQFVEVGTIGILPESAH